MTEETIQQLVSKVQTGKAPSAFNLLVVHHQSAIRRLMMHLCCGDKQTADDLAQETFIKAYTHIASFRAEAKFSTWLTRIAYRIFYDHSRSGKKTDGLPENIDTYSNMPHTEFATQTQGRLDIYGGLKLLNSHERTALTLFYLEDRPTEEVAQIMGMPIGTVKSHLSRGRKHLAEYLRNNGYHG